MNGSNGSLSRHLESKGTMTTRITITTITIQMTVLMISRVTIMTDKAFRLAFLGVYEKYKDEQ